jgi:hypothetical protein
MRLLIGAINTFVIIIKMKAILICLSKSHCLFLVLFAGSCLAEEKPFVFNVTHDLKTEYYTFIFDHSYEGYEIWANQAGGVFCAPDEYDDSKTSNYESELDSSRHGMMLPSIFEDGEFSKPYF